MAMGGSLASTLPLEASWSSGDPQAQSQTLVLGHFEQNNIF